MVLLVLAMFVGISFGISEEEVRRDLDYMKSVEKSLNSMDRELAKGSLSRDRIGELNSYGYPLNSLRDKYASLEGEKYRRISERADSLYKKVLYIKRGVFPGLLTKEARELNLPLCKAVAKGKDRKTLLIVLEDPKDEEVVLKLMTQTQLQFAHLIGIEAINFEKCKH